MGSSFSLFSYGNKGNTQQRFFVFALENVRNQKWTAQDLNFLCAP